MRSFELRRVPVSVEKLHATHFDVQAEWTYYAYFRNDDMNLDMDRKNYDINQRVIVFRIRRLKSGRQRP